MSWKRGRVWRSAAVLLIISWTSAVCQRDIFIPLWCEKFPCRQSSLLHPLPLPLLLFLQITYIFLTYSTVVEGKLISTLKIYNKNFKKKIVKENKVEISSYIIILTYKLFQKFPFLSPNFEIPKTDLRTIKEKKKSSVPETKSV